MRERFGIDIYLHIRRTGRQDIYTSYDDFSWPKGIKDTIVSQHYLSFLDSTDPAEANCYPLPNTMTPANFEQDTEKAEEKGQKESS
ncbi:hypothetical protein BU26DRAFT_263491 [Trematosphaeria pertusa]|uniref:Uncharacterized protein n=1 Tax=Trematosphaeria pertusa TaxID=390896 RepID=A0A6A6HRP5_9PLEO|nr:uncharacterized protein BU26DRAFT_263491 [Trematosphaeria pertusa]KAF2240213.1 hypothetical protein BU26DRAFT_263491 [Trematosphaeria pertusa]